MTTESTAPLEARVSASHPRARMPTRAGRAAGYDVYAVEATTVKPGERDLLPTGLHFEVPPGHYLRVAPRSGIAWRHGVQTGAGVVDEDYRGEVKVLLFNHGDADFHVNAGDRIAQVIFERVSAPVLVAAPSLAETGRGAAGFGSTGK